MSESIKEQLSELFKGYKGVYPQYISPLPRSGSERIYYRLSSQNLSIIGVFNPDVKENRTFFYLTQHFKKLDFPVADILSVSDDERLYLLTDLGNETLFNRIISANWESESSNTEKLLLQKSLKLLSRIQVEGANNLDFSKCYPKSVFDEQSVLWDLNYFKYCFLKPSGVRFNETRLENDFLALSKFLLSHKIEYFHYRDFQSRNIMLVNNEPYIIDYQGGRRGPLLYDAASFLYQAKANLPQWLRDELLNYYLDSVNELLPIDKKELQNEFPAFVLFRLLQTLGAYGFRGFFERKTHFIQSIPFAANNIKFVINRLPLDIQYLSSILEEISNKFGSVDEQIGKDLGLTIEVNSFSFKNGYPKEHHEHGGGFVFDCRALPNPGRLLEYKQLTGNDSPVIDYLNKQGEAQDFFSSVLVLVTKSVDVYLDKGFTHLSVSFGCTGGQHRSVYMANRMANKLKQITGLRVILNHRELNN